jgi:hypothetical protein
MIDEKNSLLSSEFLLHRIQANHDRNLPHGGGMSNQEGEYQDPHIHTDGT